jgi:hypothetical protein
MNGETHVLRGIRSQERNNTQNNNSHNQRNNKTINKQSSITPNRKHKQQHKTKFKKQNIRLAPGSPGPVRTIGWLALGSPRPVHRGVRWLLVAPVLGGEGTQHTHHLSRRWAFPSTHCLGGRIVSQGSDDPQLGRPLTLGEGAVVSCVGEDAVNMVELWVVWCFWGRGQVMWLFTLRIELRWFMLTVFTVLLACFVVHTFGLFQGVPFTVLSACFLCE